MLVKQMQSSNGNKVNNQYIISTTEGTYFQSYNTIIAFRNLKGEITLDLYKWNYSKTTSKYRNYFTGLSTKETIDLIKSGEIKLERLN